MASSGSRDFELDVAEYVEEAFERCGLEVEEGLLVILAVAELVPPVIVSPTLKLPEAATVIVSVPKGYSAIPLAKVILSCVIVQRFNPLLAQSANNIFKDLLADCRS